MQFHHPVIFLYEIKCSELIYKYFEKKYLKKIHLIYELRDKKRCKFSALNEYEKEK